MRQIFLIATLLSSLLLAEQSLDEKRQQIADTKAQIEALQASLKEMESSLPKQIQKDKEAKLAKLAEANRIKLHAELGYVNSKGNTNTESFAVDSNVNKSWDKHTLSFALDAEYASDNGTDTKNKYLAELEYDYKLCGRLSFDYLTGYKYDEFSGYDYSVYTGPGLKYDAITTDKHNLVLRSNILYARDKIKETNKTNDYASFRAKGLYSWQMLENLKFEETLTYRTEVEKLNNSFIYSKTAFISKLNSMFSVSLSYKVDYVNLPETGKKHSDRTTTANLIADF